jgi:hypothetical protein
MSDYLFGNDVLGAADDGAMPDAVQALVAAEKPMAPGRARDLISFAIDALAEMNFFDRDEDTMAWRDDMAQQLARMDERIADSAAAALPDKATDVLSTAISSVAEMLDEGGAIYPQILRIQDRFLQSLGVAIQVLGARTKQTAVLGDDDAFFSEIVGGPAVFDNTQTYGAGAVVYHRERYWRALRDVTPPFLPSLMSGDAPGDSDAWREISAAQAYPGSNVSGVDDVLGELAEVLGMFDIGKAQQLMNGLKPVSVGVARALVRGGQQVIAVAQTVAHARDLPDIKTLATTAGHLQWHADKLAKLKDEKAIYSSGDDAKKWAMQAFIESNAVEEGAAYLDEAWTAMWQEIGTRLAELPKDIVQTIAQLPGKAFEAATGIPSWAFYVGTAALVGLVGYGAYRILAGPAGGALVGHYLGGRR